jgi:hypothetical protein
MILSGQLMLGFRRAWLPAMLARRSISRKDYAAIVKQMLPVLRRLESFVRPRVSWLANDWVRLPLGLVCLALSTAITLPIPLAHVPLGSAICFLAIGLMERDGLVLGLALVGALAGLTVVTATFGAVVDVVHNWFTI